VQPTDQCVWSVFVFPQDTKAAEGGERGTPARKQGLLGTAVRFMKNRLIQFLSVIGAVAAMAIAGGASLQGF
jgi:hypothetical protein